MRNKIIFKRVHRVCFEHEQWDSMKRLFPQAHDIQRDTHVDEALLCQVHHLTIHLENTAARRYENDLEYAWGRLAL